MQALLLAALVSCQKQDMTASRWTRQPEHAPRSKNLRKTRTEGVLVVGAAIVIGKSHCQVGSPMSLNAGPEVARGNLRQAAWLLDTAVQQRQAVNAHVYSNLIKTFAGRSEMREAVAWLNQARASNISLDSEVYAAVTPNLVRRDVAPRDSIARAGPRDWWSHVRKMRYEGFWEGTMPSQRVLHWLQYAFQSKPLPELDAVQDAIRSLQRADKPDLAAKWLRKASDLRLHAQASLFRSVIMQCCASKLDTVAEDMLETMVSIGLTPTSDIYRALCTSKAILNKEAEVEHCLSLLEDREKDLAPFCLMSCNHAEEGNHRNAEAWLERAYGASLEPDLQCYNKVLAAHVRSPKGCATKWQLPKFRAAAACRCLQQMQRKAAQPDSVSYRHVIRGLARAGESRTSIDYMEAMMQRKLAPDLQSYNSLLHCLMRKKEVALGTEWLQRMLDTGVAADEVSFHAVLRSNLAVGQFAEAEEWLKKMIAFQLTPGRLEYNELLEHYSKLGNVEKAYFLLTLMKATPPSLPDAVTFQHLITAANDENLVDKLLSEMRSVALSPDVITYTSLVQNCASQGAIEQASRWLERMVADTLQPNVLAFNVLIASCARQSERSEKPDKVSGLLAAEQWLERLCNSKCRPDVMSYMPLLSGYARCGAPENVLEYLKKMLNSSVEPDQKTWLVCSQVNEGEHIPGNSTAKAIQELIDLRRCAAV